jgi:glycosyltransferase involved in cell wall biosynthesis
VVEPSQRYMRVPRVIHLTTSYPRDDGDFAGRFVADLVKGLRAGGVDAEVLAPGDYRDFGLAYGGGIVHNIRRRPWLAPLLVLSMILAVRRVARRGDLVHAHWLAAGLICVLARRPFVLTLHGSGTAGRFSDLELARRRPGFVGFIVRRAKVVLCVSKALAEAARGCGAADVRVVPNSVEVPTSIAPEADPPEVLFAGRLSPEKGIRELAAATQGMNLVVAGDGPLRDLVPDALGFVPHEEVVRLQSRAAVVVLPSHSEGLPVCLLEAMASGRAVVATSVGGIPDVVEDGVTGLLVEPGDVEGLRAALERLLADPALRRRLGRAARTRIVDQCSVEAVAEATRDAYLLPDLRRPELAEAADDAYGSLGRATTSIPSLQ